MSAKVASRWYWHGSKEVAPVLSNEEMVAVRSHAQKVLGIE